MSEHNCCPSQKDNGSPEHNHNQGRFDWLMWGSFVLVVLGFSAHALFGHMDWGWPPLQRFTHAAYEMVTQMWWGIIAAFVFVGLVERIPRDLIMSALGTGRGLTGIWRATLAGVAFDLCSHGILMVGMKLYERGASLGQVMAFLIASPWNSLSLTIILIALIGWQWTLTFIVLSLVIALIAGVAFNALVARGVLPDNPNAFDLPEGFNFWPEAKKLVRNISITPGSIVRLLEDGVIGSKMVIRWLLFGIVLAGVLRMLVTPDAFPDYFGATAAGLALTLGLATILEVCSEGTVPVAADILTKGAAPGNAFAFLMAGVATDYTEVMVLRDTTKSWKIALFLPLLVLPQVVVLALVINGLAG